MNDKITQSIVDKITQLLTINGLTGAEYGRILGLKKSPMTDWKNKKSNPTLDQIIFTSEYFNVSVDWLLTGEGEMYKSNTDIQDKTFSENELTTDEEIILETYKELDSNGKKEALKFMILETEKQKIPKSKLYTSMNISKDEIVTTHELRKAI